MMSGVSAPPRDYKAAPARERSSEKLDETAAPDEAVETQDSDATRSVQDLIAAALKMFANNEPKVEPPAIQAPALQVAAAPNLEAAVQQVLDQIVAKPAGSAEPTTDIKSDEPAAEGEQVAPDGVILVDPELQTDSLRGSGVTSKGPVATTAVRDPAPLPENDNPSHVHLVLDDGPERVVVTVAVRGTDVSATIRGGDEQTAAALARNAASLDHALRAGGLDLSSFTSERDLDHHARREQKQREQDSDFSEEMT